MVNERSAIAMPQKVVAPQAFEWPETLVIDVLCEQYTSLLEDTAIPRIAKVHAMMLKAVFENKSFIAASIRGVLVCEGERLGITAQDVAAVDRCAFWEIATLVQQKLRPSARNSRPIPAALHAAVCRLGVCGAAA